MKKSSKKSLRGFTLIELLVAMAITTIIITVLLSVTSMALDTWNRSRTEVRAARQAKSMIDTMARDFDSFVSRKANNFQWLYANSNPSSAGPKGNGSPNAAELVFFSAATDRYNGQIGVANVDLGGDVSTIGYQLVYKDPIASSATDDYKTFVLYRKLIDPKETFEKNLGQATLAGKVDFGEDGSNIVSAEQNFICENVYQFTITFHVSTTVGGIQKSVTVPIGRAASAAPQFSITGNGIVTTYAPPASTGVSNVALQAGRVTAAEISITVLSDFGIQQMKKRSFTRATAAETDAALAEFIAKHSYQYSKVVQLPSM